MYAFSVYAQHVTTNTRQADILSTFILQLTNNSVRIVPGAASAYPGGGDTLNYNLLYFTNMQLSL